MKKWLLKVISLRGKIFYKKIQYLFKIHWHQYKSNDEIFSTIYKNNYWGSSESVSGPGSEKNHTENLVKEINRLLENYPITTILDLPCGDFNWMKHVKLENKKYIGADIVPELITNNNIHFKSENISFCVLNIIKNELPQADIIICRDCLVHFSFININKALDKIKLSGTKYLLATSFNNFPGNYNIIDGQWRPLNLLRSPFNLPTPLLTIRENISNFDIPAMEKYLCLWELDKLDRKHVYQGSN